MEIPRSISISGNQKSAEKIIERIWGKKGKFTCTVASTLTSSVPGISEAGDTPELTLLTGPADGEILSMGKSACINGVPLNPGNIPSPSVLTTSALKLAGMVPEVIDAGCKVTPQGVKHHSGEPMADSILSGKAVPNPQKLFEFGVELGMKYSEEYDYVVVSESCAGGTTTALAVMMAMGTIKDNLVSSSSPNNPKSLKSDLVKKAFEINGIGPGDLFGNPMKAVELFGDNMIPINAGIIVGASKKVPVIAGGGTQMGAVMAVALAKDKTAECNIMQGTTRWLMNDQNCNMPKIMEGISDVIPTVYVNMDYSNSPYTGLQAYERGFIKEGVGCGAACISAILSSKGKIGCEEISAEVHRVYKSLTGFE